MKRTLLALAALASVSTLASAQSSVTLFGVVDASVRSVKNGSAGSRTELASGDNMTSRWGLRGVEDLGGGLKASFYLESQIALDTGAADAAKFFGRRSTVSLSGGFGEVRLGRDYTPSFWNALGDEFGIVGIGSRGIFLYGGGSNLGSGASTVIRADNAISYFLPNMGGFSGQIMYAPDEGVVGNQHTGGSLGYKNQALDVGVAYGVTDVGTTSDFKHYNVKFNYNFGFATLHTLYDVKAWSGRKTQDISVGASIPVATGTIRAGYTRANRSGGPVGSGYADGDDSARLAVGYVHDLSKRTALYTTISRITNKGAARSSVLGTPPAGMLGGQNSSGYEVGLRHTF